MQCIFSFQWSFKNNISTFWIILVSPYNLVLTRGNNLKWQQLTLNAVLLKPEVHVCVEMWELCWGSPWPKAKDQRTAFLLTLSRVCSKLIQFFLKILFQGQWESLLYSIIKNQRKCSWINLPPYFILNSEQDPVALHSWFFILSHFRYVVTCIEQTIASRLALEGC